MRVPALATLLVGVFGGIFGGVFGNNGCVRMHVDPGGTTGEQGAVTYAVADTALGRAVWRNDAAAVERLAREDGVDACQSDGSSPLGLAALLGSPAVIEALLASGADLGLPCDAAVTAIEAVMSPLVEVNLGQQRNSDTVTVETMALPDIGRPYGSEADVRDRLRALTILFDAGAEPNCPDIEPDLEASDECHTPPLVTAILTGDRRFVEVLLEHGAKPDSLGFGQRMAVRLTGNGPLLDFALKFRPGPSDR